MDPMIASNIIKKALTEEVYSNVSGHAFLKKHIQVTQSIIFSSSARFKGVAGGGRGERRGRKKNFQAK